MELVDAFGKTFLDTLDQPVLEIGRDRWSKTELAADLKLSNPIAARNVTRFCLENKIKSTRELYDKTSPYSLAGEMGIGLTFLYVVWQAFRSKGLDPEKWYRKGEKGAIVTFNSYKRREHEAEVRTKERKPPMSLPKPSELEREGRKLQ